MLWKNNNILDLPGLVEFKMDPSSECVTQNIATAIDPYTTKVTLDSTNAFTFPTGETFKKCNLKICATTEGLAAAGT